MKYLSEEEMRSIGFEPSTVFMNKDIRTYTKQAIIIQVAVVEDLGICIYNMGLLGRVPILETLVFVGNITELSELKSKLKELNISYDGDN